MKLLVSALKQLKKDQLQFDSNFVQIANGNHQNCVTSRLMAQIHIIRKKICIISHTFFSPPECIVAKTRAIMKKIVIVQGMF